MSAGNFALFVLFLLALSSVPALIYAKRHGFLSFAEFLLPAAPAVLLYVSMDIFNEPAHTGWAFITYPFLAVVLSVVLLYARVFLLRCIRTSAFHVSVLVLAASCVVAFLFGVIAPPWYE